MSFVPDILAGLAVNLVTFLSYQVYVAYKKNLFSNNCLDFAKENLQILGPISKKTNTDSIFF